MVGTNDATANSQADREALVDALAQTAFAITAVLSRVAAEHDLSLTQLRVLAILRDRRVRMSELAEFLGLEKSTMSGLVDRAEKRGCLRGRRTQKTGAWSTRCSPAGGAELARELFAEVSESLLPVIRPLAVAEQRRLQALLSAMLGGEARRPSRATAVGPQPFDTVDTCRRELCRPPGVGRLSAFLSPTGDRATACSP